MRAAAHRALRAKIDVVDYDDDDDDDNVVDDDDGDDEVDVVDDDDEVENDRMEPGKSGDPEVVNSGNSGKFFLRMACIQGTI